LPAGAGKPCERDAEGSSVRQATQRLSSSNRTDLAEMLMTVPFDQGRCSLAPLLPLAEEMDRQKSE
jgi:hypothetical protein